MDPIAVIATKRDGGELSTDQIREVIAAYTAGDVAPEQMSSLLMAIVLNGMGRREIADWTAAMVDSGVRLDLSGLRTVDKHSTGGVGDKITLPLTPLVASYGLAVPQLSGRGLGHTGGTLDKLESIPGWRADLTVDEMRAQLREVGAVVCAATADLAPADRKLYALRDVTGTVASIPLIAASIMSKKIAEGTGALVLDVKVGSGAFMKNRDDADKLARAMVELGSDAGVDTRALLTDMSSPLGRTAGNAVEVAESLEVLAGAGPSDVVELTLALAREMLDAGGLGDVDPAENLRNGRAMDTWRAMITGQGGDSDAPLPAPRHTHVIAAEADGRLAELDALAVGEAAWLLGAGRSRPGDSVSYAAGVTWHVGVGDEIRSGDPLFTLSFDDESRLDRAVSRLADAAVIADSAPSPGSRLLGRVTR
ncbi:thymidine phosphorylase [Gordonia sp. HY002]|uniref:thymidine phosphorylase n=1 Tax=Gordonia zhenghanii TaxID=2911516 RepID=UPI001EF096B7|nr:thymidine phosphorylase [Gordonia zhenghanii]MCF8570513.1 thymidine phosphorylase [Gordonia zhenghanii]MCF8602530.1 thymidine phosphorylase [Gordonia zhenghanii]